MSSFNIADLLTLTAVISVMVICIRNLTVRKTRGKNCGGCSCGSCNGCNLAALRKQ